jgi:hypothetical protein
MPPARKSQTSKSPKPASPQEEQVPVFATVHLLPTFKPGDRLDTHLQPAVLDLLLARGEAAHEWAPEPDPERAPDPEPVEMSIRDALADAAVPDPADASADDNQPEE